MSKKTTLIIIIMQGTPSLPLCAVGQRTTHVSGVHEPIINEGWWCWQRFIPSRSNRRHYSATTRPCTTESRDKVDYYRTPPCGVTQQTNNFLDNYVLHYFWMSRAPHSHHPSHNTPQVRFTVGFTTPVPTASRLLAVKSAVCTNGRLPAIHQTSQLDRSCRANCSPHPPTRPPAYHAFLHPPQSRKANGRLTHHR